LGDGCRRRLTALCAGALLLGGCGGGAEVSPAPSGQAATATATAPAEQPAPPLCRRLSVRVTGRVQAPAATELSGLVESRSQPSVLWTHNDSGDRPRVLAISASGRLLADVAVAGAQAVDWEDIAAGPDTILLGDIGDNPAQRESISVYEIAEPPIAPGSRAATATAQASRFELRYPDGPRDAETLLRDPGSGAVVIVEKSFDGRSGVYVAGRFQAGVTRTMRRAGRLRLGPGELVTAGDVSKDGRTIALRTYSSAFVWRRRTGESVAATLLRRRPCTVRADLTVEGQAESLALDADGSAFYTVPEGSVPALRRYAPVG